MIAIEEIPVSRGKEFRTIHDQYLIDEDIPENVPLYIAKP